MNTLLCLRDIAEGMLVHYSNQTNICRVSLLSFLSMFDMSIGLLFLLHCYFMLCVGKTCLGAVGWELSGWCCGCSTCFRCFRML